ncbi:hypothetical protein B0O99DRAFT_700889 [Bisporella sp. PMI_857]|nr:hypothetical protein B0O99DRAFT_700889 [Bisporella sp. PMI_857]
MVQAENSAGDEGREYVVIGANGDVSPRRMEDNQCPEVLYKVQYKDYGGNLRGTKNLEEPYKLKKPAYSDSEVPILEILYTITVFFPALYNCNKHHFAEKDNEAEIGSDRELKEEFDERSMEEKKLIIHSKQLIKVLRSIIIVLKEPFSILVHYRKELEDYMNNSDNTKTTHYISVLLKYLEDNLGDKILEEDARYVRLTSVARFEMLWMLYKPGEDVYAQIDEQRGGFVVQLCEPVTESRKWGMPMPLKVHIWYLDYDGIKVGRRPDEVIIAPYEGEREITSLKVFPAKYLDCNPDLSPRKRLEDRGEKFYSMLLGKQVDYNSFSMPAKKKPKRYYSGRVIADQGSFYTYAEYTETDAYPAPNIGVDDASSGILAYLHYDCNCNQCNETRRAASSSSGWATYENIDFAKEPDLAVTKPDGTISRHRYFLFPRRIMGFDLKSKKWQALDVDFCKEPRIKIEAIENFVFPAEKLELIKALVHKYTSSKRKPGATFTAECVAEFTSRPLLSLTCGDIGTDEFAVEEVFSKWFKLAEIWGAVMLIDEADVYLERREVNELTRNGLVSVFLRAMEYYRGILFLTTNRVGYFDPAFFSRIHVYIGYKPVDLEGRKRIWLQFFQKLELERAGEVVVKAGAKKYIFSDDVLKDRITLRRWWR